MNSSTQALRKDLHALADRYTDALGNRSEGLATLGEHLLQYADWIYLNEQGAASWAALLAELKTRSG